MSHKEDSLAVRRQLLPEQHKTLLGNTPFVKESCGDLSMKWFDLGTVTCTLIERSEYKQALRRPGGILWNRDANSVAQSIGSKLTEMSTGKSALDATVSDIEYTGYGRYLRIAYILDSPKLMAENQQLRDYIDAENLSKNAWQPFTPRIHVAMIKRQEAYDDVLEAVWQIGRPVFTLMPPEPMLIDP